MRVRSSWLFYDFSFSEPKRFQRRTTPPKRLEDLSLLLDPLAILEGLYSGCSLTLMKNIEVRSDHLCETILWLKENDLFFL